MLNLTSKKRENAEESCSLARDSWTRFNPTSPWLEKSYKRIREDNTKVAATKICQWHWDLVWGAIKILYTALLLDHCPVKEINFDFAFVSALAVSLSLDGFFYFQKGGPDDTHKHPATPMAQPFTASPMDPPPHTAVPSLVGNACLSVTL